jgi:hypothetical protein
MKPDLNLFAQSVVIGYNWTKIQFPPFSLVERSSSGQTMSWPHSTTIFLNSWNMSPKLVICLKKIKNSTQKNKIHSPLDIYIYILFILIFNFFSNQILQNLQNSDWNLFFKAWLWGGCVWSGKFYFILFLISQSHNNFNANLVEVGR